MKEDKGKTLEPTKHNPPESSHYILSHCNIETIEYLCNTSYTLWKDAWIFETCTTSHMIFLRDFFEDFNVNVDGIMNSVNKLGLKPSGMGTIRLKFHGFMYFLLHNVLYFPEMQRNLLSHVHI